METMAMSKVFVAQMGILIITLCHLEGEVVTHSNTKDAQSFTEQLL
jgi:hypothetical protein